VKSHFCTQAENRLDSLIIIFRFFPFAHENCKFTGEDKWASGTSKTQRGLKIRYPSFIPLPPSFLHLKWVGHEQKRGGVRKSLESSMNEISKEWRRGSCFFSGSFIDRLQRRWIPKTRRNITSKSIFHFHYIFCSLQFSFRKSLEQTVNTISYLSLLSLFLFFVSHLILYFCRRVELYRLSKSQFIVLPSPSSKSAFWRKVEIHLPLRNATVPWYRLSEQKFVYV
jgi:hypothetical protein